MLFAAPSDTKLGLQSDGGGWGLKPAKSTGDKRPKVLLIGDSIMNGYRGRVAGSLRRNATVDVWLTGMHLKSEHLHAGLRKVLAQGSYDVIHFNIGLHGWPKGRIPEGEYELLLRAYVDIIRENSKGAKPIWASTTQITEKGRPIKLDTINNKTITDRNLIAAKVMKEYGIPVNDLYALMSDKLQLACGDKFHWTGAGYAVMAEQIVSLVKKELGPAGSCAIVCPKDAAGNVRLAAMELRRYIYLRSGELLPVV